MGGGDEPENLVWLTGREHCIAHLLLAFAYGGKLWAAAAAMGLLVGGRKGECARLVSVARKRAAQMRYLECPIKYEWLEVLTGEVYFLTRSELRLQHGVPLTASWVIITNKNKGCYKVRKGFTLLGANLEKEKPSKQRKTRKQENVDAGPKSYEIMRLSDGEIFNVTFKQMIDELGFTKLAARFLTSCTNKSLNDYVRTESIQVPQSVG
jgi:hypothetical protein